MEGGEGEPARCRSLLSGDGARVLHTVAGWVGGEGSKELVPMAVLRSRYAFHSTSLGTRNLIFLYFPKSNGCNPGTLLPRMRRDSVSGHPLWFSKRTAEERNHQRCSLSKPSCHEGGCSVTHCLMGIKGHLSQLHGKVWSPRFGAQKKVLKPPLSPSLSS